jgi:hypothetical protein
VPREPHVFVSWQGDAELSSMEKKGRAMATTETQSQMQTPAASPKPSYRIKSISISLELADKNFGSGMTNCANIQAYVDDASLGEINDVINAGLMLYIAAWRTVMAGQLVTKLGAMTGNEVREIMGKINSRLGKVKALLHEVNGE